jgi:hypothetical protein
MQTKSKHGRKPEILKIKGALSRVIKLSDNEANKERLADR